MFVILSFISILCQSNAGQFKDISNSSEFHESELLLMLQKQQDLCPYAPLCIAKNTSTEFVKSHYRSIPCCYPCSCNKSCIQNNTCCPDFLHNLDDAIKTDGRLSESSETRIQCVKVQYGPIENNSGYKMIAACPETYTNQTTVTLCNRDFDYENVGTFTDHIPVFERVSGQIYKNKYCFLCNAVNTTTVQHWNIIFNCTGNFGTVVYPSQGPLDLIESYLRRKRCNVVFKSNPAIKEYVNSKLEACQSSSWPMIRSCKAEYAGTDTEKLCKQYVWPVKMNSRTGFRLYRNYACMICNGVLFREKCHEVNLKRFHAISFLTGQLEVLTSMGSSSLNGQSDDGLSLINRFFPDSLGNVVCQKGFIFHRRTKTCREIICPMNFFLRNGVCVPLFDALSGMGYLSHIEIIFPPTVNGIKSTDFEQAVHYAINQRFRPYMDNDDYMFSLWSNRHTSGNIDPSRKYYLLTLITGQDDYTEFVKFLYWFVILGSKIQVNVGSHCSQETFISLHFPDVSTIVTGKPLGPRGVALHLIEPKSWLKALATKEEMTAFVQAAKSLLCYRVALNISEVEIKHGAVVILETRKILTIPNYQLEKPVVFACVEDAFDGIPNVSKYIFSNDGNLNPGNANEDFIYNKINSTQGEGTNTFSKSVLTTTCTFAFIVLVVGIKKYVRKCTKLSQYPNLRISKSNDIIDTRELCFEMTERGSENKNVIDAREMRIENRKQINENDDVTDSSELHVKKRNEINENDNVPDSGELRYGKGKENNLNVGIIDVGELRIDNRKKINENDDVTDVGEPSFASGETVNGNDDIIGAHKLRYENRDKRKQIKA